MFKSNIAWFAAALVAGGAFGLVGCSSKPAAAPAAADAAAKETSATSIPAGFEKLSEADRAAALAQKVCPVSDEKLGEMGTPFKVTVKGRDVFLCCPNCKEDLLKDPDKYFAKLDAK
jgi:Cu(I)/Ag(I) efflux system membrane fusion protein